MTQPDLFSARVDAMGKFTDSPTASAVRAAGAAPAQTRHGDAERLRRIFESLPGQRLPMPWLRQQFLGSLTQRISELKRAGMDIVNEKAPVRGKTHSVYIYTPKGTA